MKEHDAIDRATAGAASRPLSNEQRMRLAIAARRAFEAQREAGLVSAEETAATWRRRHAMMAVERPGVRQCVNEDYLMLMAHYADMHALALKKLCDFGGAMRLAARSEGLRRRADALRTEALTEQRTWAQARLEKEYAAASDVIERPAAYVSSIARARFKTATLADLSERQIWMLIFDLRRNAARRRKQGGGQ